MGTFSVENQGAYSFLVYELDSDDVIDNLSLGMITYNKIPGISQAVFTQMDDKKFIKYNISGKVSVDQFLLGTVNRRRLLGVFAGLASAFLSADDYMIDTSTLLMDVKYMYADVRANTSVLICLPIIQTEKQPLDLHKFFKSIMFSTQFDQSENCDHIGQILNYLNGSAQFSIIEFKQIIDRLSASNAAPVPVQPMYQQSSQHPAQPTAAPVNAATASAPVNVAPAPVASRQNNTVPQSVQATPSKPAVNTPARPQMTTPQAPVRASSVPANPQEKEISLFYLLQHYNKENSELYKLQQDRKKAQKATGKPVTATVSKQSVQQPPQASYAVPGMSNPVSAGSNTSAAKPVTIPSSNGAIPVAATSVQPIIIPRQEITQQPASFGETTVLNSGSNAGETTLLSESAPVPSRAILIRLKTNERIPITKDVFRIGKEKGIVDYFVSDNAAVSRSHADIIFQDGKYFVRDNNSTNQSFVNSKLIPGNTLVLLEDGFTVTLANDQFRFERK